MTTDNVSMMEGFDSKFLEVLVDFHLQILVVIIVRTKEQVGGGLASKLLSSLLDVKELNVLKLEAETRVDSVDDIGKEVVDNTGSGPISEGNLSRDAVDGRFEEVLLELVAAHGSGRARGTANQGVEVERSDSVGAVDDGLEDELDGAVEDDVAALEGDSEEVLALRGRKLADGQLGVGKGFLV